MKPLASIGQWQWTSATKSHVSHAHGIVQMVLKDLSYTICREDNYCYGRLIFSGTVDENSPYIGKSMKHLVKHIQVTNYYNV